MKINIFACGGAGINIVAGLENESRPGTIMDFDITYCDTSRSNMGAIKNKDAKIFTLEGKDGSGKIRKTNAEQIQDKIQELMNAYYDPKNHLNIVVFSAGGGSGSTFGPYITSYLLENDKQVICCCVTADEDKVSAGNSLKTLASLEGVSKVHKKPVIMYTVPYSRLGGSKYNTYLAVEEDIRQMITDLGFLYNTTAIERIDTKDLDHWARYHECTDVPPQLTRLIRCADSKPNSGSDERFTNDIKSPISIVSVYPKNSEPSLALAPDYLVEGFSEHTNGLAYHFITTHDGISKIGESLNKVIHMAAEKSNSRSKKESLGDLSSLGETESDENGMMVF